jgi:hypothetical protein
MEFPDALVGGPAAARDGGPLLLARRDALPASTAAELARLRPARIVVLGGPTGVGDAVVNALKGYTSGSVTRLTGADRYRTGVAVSSTFAAGTSTVYIATGEAFADGLGGRLPAERGRDIGLSAGVGEATARVLQAVVKTAAGVFDAAATSLALARPGGGLEYQAAWGAGADEVVGMRLERGQGIGGRVLAAGVGEVVQDCRNDPDFAAATARRTGYVPYTMIVVPLIRDEEAVGVLTVLDKRDGSSYDIGDLARAAMFADLALAALDAEPGARAALTSTVARPA